MATAVRNRQLEPAEATRATWGATPAYAFAVLGLAFGFVVGYLLRDSVVQPAPGSGVPAPVSVAQVQTPGMGGMPAAVNVAEMVEQQAKPLLAALKKNPQSADLLGKLGNVYFDAQLYPKAVEYYGQVLKLTPANADVRTDMATAYFYMGNADRAVAEFEKSLSYRPNHGPTLMNLGVVRWQAKNDAKGAVAAWERLLKTNPNYPDKQKVVNLIARAKQHAQMQ